MSDIPNSYFQVLLQRELNSLRQRLERFQSGDLFLVSRERDDLTRHEIELLKSRIAELEGIFGADWHLNSGRADARRAFR